MQIAKHKFKRSITKVTILASLFFLVQACTSHKDGNFQTISNKTWFDDNSFTGTSIVFFTTANGLQKAIRQINGSSLPILSSEIYDIKFVQDKIHLYNGLNLNTSEKLPDLYYNIESKTPYLLSKGKPLRIVNKEVVLYAWMPGRKYSPIHINFYLLKEISIEKNTIYKFEDIEKILEEKE